MERVNIDVNTMRLNTKDQMLLMEYNPEKGLEMASSLLQIIVSELNSSDELYEIIEELCKDYKYEYNDKLMNIALKIAKNIEPSVTYNNLFETNKRLNSLLSLIVRIINKEINVIKRYYLTEYVKMRHPELTDISGVKDFNQANFIMGKYEEYLQAIQEDVMPTPPEIDSEGRVVFHKGDLFHGRSSNESTIRSIASRGIESGQLHNTYEDGETFFCSDFFKVSKDVMTPEEICRFGGQYTNVSNRIVFVINALDVTGEQAIFPNLSMYDAYDETTLEGQTARSFVNTKALPLNSDNAAAILIGMPTSLISSIIVNDGVEQDQNKINLLSELFPKACIVSRKTGLVIKSPEIQIAR